MPCLVQISILDVSVVSKTMYIQATGLLSVEDITLITDKAAVS